MFSLALRVRKKDGKHFFEKVAKVSCPTCERIMEVPDDLAPGDTLTCCGEKFLLTHEFGAYASGKTKSETGAT